MADTLQQMQANPATFRAHIHIQTGKGRRKFSEIVAPFQEKDFKSLDGPFMALRDGTKPEPGRFWIERTKGAAKDSDVGLMVLWLLFASARSVVCQVGAVDKSQAQELQRIIQSLVKINDWLAGTIKVHAYHITNWRTGSTCQILPSDAPGAHGSRPDLTIINEISHVPKREFIETLLDNAAKMPYGVTVVITNAGFVGSWQHDIREQVLASGRWKFSAFTEVAPWIDPAEVEEIRKREAPGRFRRLWQGEWIFAAGDALKEEDLNAALTLAGPGIAPEPSFAYHCGVDLALSRDRAAVVLIGKHSSGRVRLIRALSWSPPFEQGAIRQACFDLYLKWGCRFAIDSYQAATLAEELKKQGALVELLNFSGKKPGEMASAVVEMFASRCLDLFYHAELMADLRSLRLIEGPGGYLKLDAPRNASGHSDLAFALAMALMACRGRPVLAPTAPEHWPCVLTAGHGSPYGDLQPVSYGQGRKSGALGVGAEALDFANFISVHDDIPAGIDPEMLRQVKNW
jgi:hypothetical protein